MRKQFIWALRYIAIEALIWSCVLPSWWSPLLSFLFALISSDIAHRWICVLIGLQTGSYTSIYIAIYIEGIQQSPFCLKWLTVIHTFIHWWRWLQCKVPTSTWGAVCGLVGEFYQRPSDNKTLAQTMRHSRNIYTFTISTTSKNSPTHVKIPQQYY